jgi:hypothetical protein
MQGTSWWKGRKILVVIMSDNRAKAKFLATPFARSGQTSVLNSQRVKGQLLNSCALMAMAPSTTA